MGNKLHDCPYKKKAEHKRFAALRACMDTALEEADQAKEAADDAERALLPRRSWMRRTRKLRSLAVNVIMLRCSGVRRLTSATVRTMWRERLLQMHATREMAECAKTA